MTNDLYEVEVLAGRALSRGLRAYLPGERLTLDEAEADALEINGFVIIVGRATPPKRIAPIGS
jgi:hypothetical protein